MQEIEDTVGSFLRKQEINYWVNINGVAKHPFNYLSEKW